MFRIILNMHASSMKQIFFFVNFTNNVVKKKFTLKLFCDFWDSCVNYTVLLKLDFFPVLSEKWLLYIFLQTSLFLKLSLKIVSVYHMCLTEVLAFRNNTCFK